MNSTIECGGLTGMGRGIRACSREYSNSKSKRVSEKRAAAAGQSSSAPSTIHPNGLLNMAHTCYANVLLQMIFWTDDLRNEILARELKPVEEMATEMSRRVFPTSVGSNNIEMTPLKLAHALHALKALFRQMATNHSKVINPKSFIDALGLDYSVDECALEIWTAIFSFFVEYLDMASLFEVKSVRYTQEIVTEDHTRSPRTSEIIDSSPVIYVEPDRQSLLAALDKEYRDHEIIRVQDGNGWHPDDTSNEKVDARKGMSLADGLPPVLTISLKRFSYNLEHVAGSKIGTRFEFPLSLDMAPYLSGRSTCNQTKYTLQFIIMHKGKTLGGDGHYYAYSHDIKKQQWYLLNDSTVSKMTEDAVLDDAFAGKSCAYMLQYAATSNIPSAGSSNHCLEDVCCETRQVLRDITNEKDGNASKAASKKTRKRSECKQPKNQSAKKAASKKTRKRSEAQDDKKQSKKQARLADVRKREEARQSGLQERLEKKGLVKSTATTPVSSDHVTFRRRRSKAPPEEVEETAVEDRKSPPPEDNPYQVANENKTNIAFMEDFVHQLSDYQNGQNNALVSQLENTEAWKELQRIYSDLPEETRAFVRNINHVDSHVRNSKWLMVLFIANFAPSNPELLNKGLLTLSPGSNGYLPTTLCWRKLIQLFVNILEIVWKIPQEVGTPVVMSTVAVVNRLPFEAIPNFATNSKTNSIYKQLCKRTDSSSREIIKTIIEDSPNLTATVVLGKPAFKFITEEKVDNLSLVHKREVPHMTLIVCGWLSTEQQRVLVDAIVRACCMLLRLDWKTFKLTDEQRNAIYATLRVKDVTKQLDEIQEKFLDAFLHHQSLVDADGNAFSTNFLETAPAIVNEWLCVIEDSHDKNALLARRQAFVTAENHGFMGTIGLLTCPECDRNEVTYYGSQCCKITPTGRCNGIFTLSSPLDMNGQVIHHPVTREKLLIDRFIMAKCSKSTCGHYGLIGRACNNCRSRTNRLILTPEDRDKKIGCRACVYEVFGEKSDHPGMPTGNYWGDTSKCCDVIYNELLRKQEACKDNPVQLALFQASWDNRFALKIKSKKTQERKGFLIGKDNFKKQFTAMICDREYAEGSTKKVKGVKHGNMDGVVKIGDMNYVGIDLTKPWNRRFSETRRFI